MYKVTLYFSDEREPIESVFDTDVLEEVTDVTEEALVVLRDDDFFTHMVLETYSVVKTETLYENS